MPCLGSLSESNPNDSRISKSVDFLKNKLDEELENKALDFASAWGKTSDQLTDAREEAESLGRELAGAKNGVNESTGRTVEEIEADIKKNDQLISDLLSNLDKLKNEYPGLKIEKNSLIESSKVVKNYEIPNELLQKAIKEVHKKIELENNVNIDKETKQKLYFLRNSTGFQSLAKI